MKNPVKLSKESPDDLAGEAPDVLAGGSIAHRKE
jgi:hypothetical protein